MTYQDKIDCHATHGKFERKDGGGDEGAEGAVEVKGAIDKLNSIFADFKAKNDETQAAAIKGYADPLNEETLKKMNTALDEAVEGVQKTMKDRQDASQKRLDDLEARLKRARKGGTGDAGDDLEAKAVDFYRAVTGDHELVKGDARIDIDYLRQYEKQFVHYLRHGEKRAFTPDMQKDMQVGGDPRGGYWVAPTMSSRVITKLFDTSPIRSIASSETISSDRLILAVDRDEASFGWVGETSGRPITDTPNLGTREIPVHEQYAMPRATQNMIDDAQVNVEAFLERKVNDKFSRSESTAFVTGNGVNKPRGYMDYSADSVVATSYDDTDTDGKISHRITADANGFGDMDSLVETVYDLKPGYRQNARWVTARQTLSAIRKLKDANGLYIWEPNVQVGQPGTLLGFGLTEAEDMPAMATDAFTVAFGNFSVAYLIVDRQGMRLLVDPYTNKPYVLYYFTRRVGGDVVEFEALKFIKQSAT